VRRLRRRLHRRLRRRLHRRLHRSLHRRDGRGSEHRPHRFDQFDRLNGLGLLPRQTIH
jgi:hypothetical protein